MVCLGNVCMDTLHKGDNDDDDDDNNNNNNDIFYVCVRGCVRARTNMIL